MQSSIGRARPTIGIVFITALVLTWLSIVVVFPILSPAVSYPDIVALEFAGFGGQDQAQSILDRWTRDNRIGHAIWDVCFDHVFILCYTIVLTLACRWSTQEFTVGGLARKAGPILSGAQVAAGLFDMIENRFLLLMLWRGAKGNPYSVQATAFATFKALFLLVGMIYIIVALYRALARVLRTDVVGQQVGQA